MAETAQQELYAADPEPQAQLSGTGSTDSDRNAEAGNPIITESEIAASEAARKDNPLPANQQPQEPAQPVDHWNTGLQKVQQELSARRQKEEQLAGRLDTLQDTLVQMMQQQSNATQNQTEAPQLQGKSAGDIVKSAFEEVDMLDSDAVQEALSNVVNGIQSPGTDPQVNETIQQMSQKIESLSSQLNETATSNYWKQLEASKGVTEEQRLEAAAQAKQNVTDKGWYGESDPRFEGAVYTELEHILDNANAKAPAQSRQPRVTGTVVKPGASARTGPPPSGLDSIPMVEDSDIWQAD